MLSLIQNQLLSWGLSPKLSLPLSVVSLAVAILLVSFLADWVAKSILLRVIRKVILKTRFAWDDLALKKRVFHRLSHLAPVLIIYSSAPLFRHSDWESSTDFVTIIQRLAIVALLAVALSVFDAFLNVISAIYERLEIAKQKPIKSYLQIVKLVVFIGAAILALSIILNKSPWAFLTGLGALTAVLLLVFKDTILGFVASVQLASYDMVRLGDWIEVPKYGADGDVIDLSLTTVKVQNWDKTIVTIPTYALISEGVKNWRGMEESGGRRIKRSINIDMNSVKFCDEKLLKRLKKIQLISGYLEKKAEEIKNYNQENKIDGSSLANGRHLTNLGTFRTYIEAYLRQHPKIHQDMTFLVRHLQPGELGLPIEIYVFSNDQAWVNFEAIQADIFDHLLAVIHEFDLRVFQRPSGADFKKLI